MSETIWQDALRSGDLSGALAVVKDEIRSSPNDPELRLMLLHLSALSGNWEGAERQLKVYGELSSDEDKQLLTLMVSSLIECEAKRNAVFSGEAEPVLFGDPLPWAAELIQMHRHLAAGEYEAAARCRELVVEGAGPVPGEIDGSKFDWLGDTDWRFCALFEVVLGGSYCWLPIQRLQRVMISEPKSLRDLIWCPANFVFTNGGDSPGFILTRYPGSEKSEVEDLVMARGTVWEEAAPGIVLAKGQRVLTDGEKDYSLLDVRRIEFETGETEAAVREEE